MKVLKGAFELTDKSFIAGKSSKPKSPSKTQQKKPAKKGSDKKKEQETQKPP